MAKSKTMILRILGASNKMFKISNFLFGECKLIKKKKVFGEKKILTFKVPASVIFLKMPIFYGIELIKVYLIISNAWSIFENRKK